MTLEFFARVNKELSITGHAFYESVLAISELVNRKVQVIRYHWQASALLQQIDEVSATLGRQIAGQVSHRLVHNAYSESITGHIDGMLSDATTRIHELKQALVHVDGQIRELKHEAIQQDLLSLQRDLLLRSSSIERLTVVRGARAVAQPLTAIPLPATVHIVTVLRGYALLPPSPELVFRPGDIVIVVGSQTDLAHASQWFTDNHPLSIPVKRSA